MLVTGATGFLGAHLTRALLRHGADVHALVRPSTRLDRIADVVDDVHLHQAALEDERQMRRIAETARPELIFHLAVQRDDATAADRQAALRTNVFGTAMLLEATATQEHRRLIHLGSSLEYGGTTEALPEAAATAPLTFYGATKAAATLLCQQAVRATGREIVILRPFHLFGPWEHPAHLVPTAIRAALHGQALPLTAPGLRRDWLFVADAVDACLLSAVADNVAGEVINVAAGQDWSNHEVVTAIGEITARPLDVQTGAFPARQWDAERKVADIAKARQLLGWTPRYSLRDGLAMTVDWTRSRSAEDDRE